VVDHEAQPASSVPNMSALVAIAEPGLAGTVAAELEALGCRVDMAPDTQTAVDRLQASPQVVVVAWGPASGHGERLCREVRQRSDGDRSVIVVVLSRHTEAPLPEWLDMADDYVRRPVRPWLLAWRLRHALRLARERSSAPVAPAAPVQPVPAVELAVDDRPVDSSSLQHPSSDSGAAVITGLPNRSSLMTRLLQAPDSAEGGTDTSLAVLYLGLDRFRNVNSSLGHAVGDLLLVAVASRIAGTLRMSSDPVIKSSVMAQMTGDEFVVLLDRITEATVATRAARLIQEALQSPFTIASHEIYVTATIGIALGTPGAEPPEELLRKADTAMNRAKAVGKSSYMVFEDTMHTGAVELLRLETELRRAVLRQEFRVMYQPIVHLGSGRIAGFEALVRWQHPSGRLIAPEEFIPVAEETGLIVAIDRFVLNEACRQIRTWESQFHRKPPLTVAVNVSGVEFMKPDTMVEIDRALRTNGIYGKSLKIEITESVIVDNARYAADMLAHLRALDIKLSIDDFGTGYSSLSYLRRFEIDTLKIDRSFVSRMDVDQECAEIVRTIVQMANNLGKEVVAEGVERRVQVDELRSLGCTYGQGYLFARPGDARTATSLLAEDAAGSRLLRP
jgi:diguanylate cyclase (GGDEF)-like protein